MGQTAERGAAGYRPTSNRKVFKSHSSVSSPFRRALGSPREHGDGRWQVLLAGGERLAEDVGYLLDLIEAKEDGGGAERSAESRRSAAGRLMSARDCRLPLQEKARARLRSAAVRR